VEGLVDRYYVEDLAEKVTLNFDTALEYVRLPQYNSPSMDSQKAIPQKGLTKSDVQRPAILDPYRGIFKWLREQGVQRIFKITVEDMGSNPHSDEGIQDALSDFGVEIWDWRKLDICSETILKAAPMVQKLNLYSSGNNAVFRSWACKHGLARLEKVIVDCPSRRSSASC